MSQSSYINRLQRFREWMSQNGVTGFLVNATDEYFNEEAPPHAQRLAWLTGFTGSAGDALILKDSAHFITDGRYTTQAKEQLPAGAFSIHHSSKKSLKMALSEHSHSGHKIGYYPWSVTASAAKVFHEAVAKKGATLVPFTPHPVDQMWADRPQQTLAPVEVHPLHYAGQPFEEKISALKNWLTSNALDAYVICSPSAIAWLLNIRGTDCARIPAPAVYAIAEATGSVRIFLKPRPHTDELITHFGNLVTIHDEDAFEQALESLSKDALKVAIDASETPQAVVNALASTENHPIWSENPISVPRAVKNSVEVDGARLAHLHDGLALVRALFWIEKKCWIKSKSGLPTATFQEMDVMQRLWEERRKSPLFRSLSFETIAGFGSNGAIVHYRATEQNNKSIDGAGLLLIDSGGHYSCGTTDVTRTIAIGTPTREQQENFTRVLRGHINLARCVFPSGTSGWHLDAIARYHLWQAGLDYSHGTGHGVGSYLSVHEGPIYIAMSTRQPHVFEPGMILSNEPGYYKPGEYGIRIESLVTIVAAPDYVDSVTNLPFLQFETLTLAPIDRRLIDASQLTRDELMWLNAYHQNVWEKLSPHLTEEDVKTWLHRVTCPL